MTAPRWPAPGATYGPDRLDEVRALLEAWPGRGEWVVNDGGDRRVERNNFHDHVSDGEVWTLFRDTQDSEPEPEPARTVEATIWAFVWADDDGQRLTFCRATKPAAEKARRDIRGGTVLTDVHEVRAALPLPVEPAVVVGTVVGGDS